MITFSSLLFFIGCKKAPSSDPYKIHQNSYLNEISLKLTGKPLPQSFWSKHNGQNNNDDLIRKAYFYTTRNKTGDNLSPEFIDWLIAFNQDAWRLKSPRQTAGEWWWWRLPRTKEIFEVNREYLERNPDRIHHFSTETAPFGGKDFDTPISNVNEPSDFGYYLSELEPLLLAASYVNKGLPYGDFLRKPVTVRNRSLNQVSILFDGRTKEVPLDLKKDAINHWTGQWYFVPNARAFEKPNTCILSSEAFLRTYSNERSWANRLIYQGLLGQEIREVSNDQELQFHFYKKNDPNPLSQDNCKGCHYMLDGIANLRMEYYHKGIPKENTTLGHDFYAHISTEYEGDLVNRINNLNNANFSIYPIDHYLLNSDNTFVTIKDFSDLCQKIADHKWFKEALVKRMFEKVFSRSPDSSDSDLISTAITVYEQTSENFDETLIYLFQKKLADKILPAEDTRENAVISSENCDTIPNIDTELGEILPCKVCHGVEAQGAAPKWFLADPTLTANNIVDIIGSSSISYIDHSDNGFINKIISKEEDQSRHLNHGGGKDFSLTVIDTATQIINKLSQQSCFVPSETQDGKDQKFSPMDYTNLVNFFNDFSYGDPTVSELLKQFKFHLGFPDYRLSNSSSLPLSPISLNALDQLTLTACQARSEKEKWVFKSNVQYRKILTKLASDLLLVDKDNLTQLANDIFSRIASQSIQSKEAKRIAGCYIILKSERFILR